MTLGQLKRSLEVSLMRDDLAEFHKDWINQALQEIYQDISYNCMRHSEEVTIESGSSFAVLPSDFKELTTGKSPICLVGTDGSLTPVDVTRRENIIRTRATFLSPISSSIGAVQVYLSNNGDEWTLNQLYEATSSSTFDVSYFRILPNLESDEDSNYLTKTYPGMVEAKVLSIGFARINDPVFATWLANYELAKRRASADDSKRWTTGRRLQMGRG